MLINVMWKCSQSTNFVKYMQWYTPHPKRQKNLVTIRTKNIATLLVLCYIYYVIYSLVNFHHIERKTLDQSKIGLHLKSLDLDVTVRKDCKVILSAITQEGVGGAGMASLLAAQVTNPWPLSPTLQSLTSVLLSRLPCPALFHNRNSEVSKGRNVASWCTADIIQRSNTVV